MFVLQHATHPTGSNTGKFTLVQNKEEESAIQELIDNNLTSHFQPIVSLEHGKIFAYEALCRTVGPNPFDNIEELFREAKISNKILQLDMRCRENGISLAAAQGLNEREALLFLNICPTSLLCPNHTAGTTGILADQHGIPIQNIVLEITEQEAVSNYQLFRKAVDHYRSKGFRIAIDDFGAGYGGLKMLSVLEPDFVKIDRHFFKDTPKSKINYNLIDSIATACHRIGIDVIAEGIENEKDLRICREIGIELGQGYLLARPAADLISDSQLQIPVHKTLRQSGTVLFSEVICVGDIATYIPPLSSADRALEALNRFNDNPECYACR